MGVAASCCVYWWGVAARGIGTQHRQHHEERALCLNTEEKSQDISQEVKAWAQIILPNEQRH